MTTIQNTTTFEATLCHASDIAPQLPAQISFELTAQETAAITEAQALLRRNPSIKAIHVNCSAPELEGWPCEDSYINVFSTPGSYLILPNSYDCYEIVEYSLDI